MGIKSTVEFILKKHGDNRRALEALSRFPQIEDRIYDAEIFPIFEKESRCPSDLFCYIQAEENADFVISDARINPEMLNFVSTAARLCLSKALEDHFPSQSPAPAEASSLSSGEIVSPLDRSSDDQSQSRN